MNLKSLTAFVTVLDRRSFRDAAAVLNTVQSNMTAHVRKLEQELGCRLVERNGTIRATAEGAVLERRAREMLRLHDLAVTELRARGEVAGALTIGAMETTAARRLPPALLALGRRYPALRLSLVAASTDVLRDKLLRREIDCAFMAKPMDGAFSSRVAFEEELFLVRPAPCDDPFAGEQLLQYPILAFRPGCTYRARAELVFERAGIGPVIHDFGSLDAIAGCLRAGMGQAVLPHSYVSGTFAHGEAHAYRLPSPLCRCPTYMVWRGEAPGGLLAALADALSA